MKLLTCFLIIGGLFVYVLICAAIMHAIEKSDEIMKAEASTASFNAFKAAKSCLKADDMNKLLDQLQLLKVSGLSLSPTGVSGSSWDFPSSIFMCFQVISAVGFGASAPKTVGGRVFVIFYTFFGLCLFIATALAIGEKLIHLADWIRKKFGIKGKRRTAYFIHAFRITMLLVVGTLLFGVIPAAIFSAIDPNFGFNEAFSVVSVAIVGYSDIVPNSEVVSPWYRLGISMWAILSLMWFAATFSTLRNIFSTYNSGAIEIPSCCQRKDDSSKPYYTSQILDIGDGQKPNDCNLNPQECNKPVQDPYPSDDMITPNVQKAVIVMGNPNHLKNNDQTLQTSDKSQKTVIVTGSPMNYQPINQTTEKSQKTVIVTGSPMNCQPINQYPGDDMITPNVQKAVIVMGNPNQPKNRDHTLQKTIVETSNDSYINQAYQGDDLVHPVSQKAVITVGSQPVSQPVSQPIHYPTFDQVVTQGTRSSIDIGGY